MECECVKYIRYIELKCWIPDGNLRKQTAFRFWGPFLEGPERFPQPESNKCNNGMLSRTYIYRIETLNRRWEVEATNSLNPFLEPVSRRSWKVFAPGKSQTYSQTLWDSLHTGNFRRFQAVSRQQINKKRLCEPVKVPGTLEILAPGLCRRSSVRVIDWLIDWLILPYEVRIPNLLSINDDPRLLAQTLEIIIKKSIYAYLNIFTNSVNCHWPPQSRFQSIYDLSTRLCPAKIFLAGNVHWKIYCVRGKLYAVTHTYEAEAQTFSSPHPFYHAVKKLSFSFLTKDW